jgi:hypothetical protein
MIDGIGGGVNIAIDLTGITQAQVERIGAGEAPAGRTTRSGCRTAARVPLEFTERGVAVLVGDCTRCVGQVVYIMRLRNRVITIIMNTFGV